MEITLEDNIHANIIKPWKLYKQLPVEAAIQQLIYDNDVKRIKELDILSIEPNFSSYLRICAHIDRPEIAEHLVKFIRNPRHLDYLLRLSVASQKLSMVKLFHSHGASVSCDNNHPLRIACCNGNVEIADYLIRNGAAVPRTSNQALQIASSNGHNDIINLLISYCPDITDTDNNAVDWASQNGHNDTVQLLINLGISTRCTENSGGLRYFLKIGANIEHFWVERLICDSNNICKDRKMTIY